MAEKLQGPLHGVQGSEFRLTGIYD
jgi:hypothetical protein